MPALKELEYQLPVIMPRVMATMNRTSLIAGDSLALLVERDTACVKGDIAAKEQHTCICPGDCTSNSTR